MKLLNYTIIFASFFLITLACNNEETKDGKNKKIVLRDSIKNTEKELHKTAEPDKSKAQEILKLYNDYYSEFKNDTLAPEYIFRAAEINLSLEQPTKAVNKLKRIQFNHKDYKNMPYTIYLIGFIYDSKLEKDKVAEEYYNKFLEKYPEHERAKEVKKLIEYLNMSDLELVKKFEEQNKQ